MIGFIDPIERVTRRLRLIHDTLLTMLLVEIVGFGFLIWIFWR